MINLLQETIEVLKENNKSFDDIIAIQTSDAKIELQDFINLANVEYDNRYGGPEVIEDLVIIGDIWCLERAEHDGFEWWAFNTKKKNQIF